VEEALERAPEAPAEAPAAAKVGELPGKEIELSQMRKTIARRLQEVWQSTPHFALTVDIDMASAMEQRAEINEQLAAADIEAKVSVNDMIVKACALALEEYPAMNVAFQGDHLVQFDDIHIGVAVAVEAGLITPTIDNANQKGLRQISEEARELAERARDKKLTPEEYTGGTFTVSNLGMYGIDHFMAVINPPQAGILACGAVDQVPVVEDGELTVGTRMKVTLSCDHRAVDGAQGAEFLNHIKRYLENPVLLMV
ncbi:MAG: dihydrolipoamide acetyltransferase family protein, partial [Persicimonas sp.]